MNAHAAIARRLREDYHSDLVEAIRQAGGIWRRGRLTLRLADAFGFCYGVDKAIHLAYETRHRFPERRIRLTNEIIHNPRVNGRLEAMGIRILPGLDADSAEWADIAAEDVVILPAFGVTLPLLDRLRRRGCTLVDTTCGSVKRVWGRVEQYARDGFTALIHGKWHHEETQATCSRVARIEGGRYIVFPDRDAAQCLCAFIRGGADAPSVERMTERFRRGASPGLDFTHDLTRVGLANQTTMLSSESLAIAETIRRALVERYGAEALDDHFRSFGTICTATQQRQDAVAELIAEPLDLMIVVGGFNSSNTTHLSKIAARSAARAWHIDDVDCLISPREIRHKPTDLPRAEPVVATDWFPATGPVRVGLTAGASTPNRVVGDVIERLLEWFAEDDAHIV